MRHRSDRTDLLHDAYRAALECLGGWDEAYGVEPVAYAHAAARYAVARSIDKAATRAHREESVGDLQDLERFDAGKTPRVDDYLWLERVREALQRAIRALDEGSVNIMLGSASAASIAAWEGVAVQTAYNRAQMFRDRLRADSELRALWEDRR